ncbi:MAG: protein kinase [Bryobacterales bacterium]|nr:protein kinase [Bryobacterales bacterium]
MDNDRWRRLQQLFETLEAMPAGDRARFLESHEPDPALRREVIQLLESARLEEEASLRHQPKPSVAVHGPAHIPGFTILSVLGSGGFSTVYSAIRRADAVDQRVAVKLFHAHRLGPDARRRFEREQRMLASFNHPAIVRFLDAGITDEGQPYLVMEEVEGSPITDHCDRARLSAGERLRLIADACRALHHAHRHLVVHLDLKPSNILVTADGQVKLLDFGTSKLLDETGALTVTQQITPLYASPERLRAEPGSVASDIFSLGLTLAELLCGDWPFAGRDSISALAARAHGTQEIRLMSALATPQAAELRGTTVERLRKTLAGDLQAICAKTLAHEPAERYSSMAELAEDIRRYQAGEPVLAHPPGFLYRVRKFARRNAAILAVTLAAFCALTAAGAYAWRERIQGTQRLEEARSMANYLLFDLYDRINELPGSTAVRARMASQAQTHLDRLAGMAGDAGLWLEAAAGYNRLAAILGVSGSSSVGQTQSAEDNLVKARRLIDRILAERPNHRQALLERASNALLSAKLQNWNRRNPTAALPLITQARRDLDATRDIKDPPWLRVSSSLAQQEADLAENDRNFGEEARITATALAELVNWPADLRAGEDYLLRVVAILKRRGNAAYYQDDYSAALTSFQEAYKQLQSFNSQHPNRPDVLYASMDMSYQMAYVFGELQQPSQMLDSTMESLRIAERLMEFDSENQALRRSYWNKRQALAESLGSPRFDGAVRNRRQCGKQERPPRPHSPIPSSPGKTSRSPTRCSPISSPKPVRSIALVRKHAIHSRLPGPCTSPVA